MRRKVFDILVSAGGIVVVALLIVAGSLLMWGSNFTNSDVHNQLAMQQVYFPPSSAFSTWKTSNGDITPTMKQYWGQWAGQEVLTGPQAEAYANHFIAVHLSEMPYGGVYSKVSAAARAAKPGSPQAAQLASLETTVFQGTTLRAMLLEAYGFWLMGDVAFWASIASFSLAFIMALLVGLGFWHARRTAQEKELLVPKTEVVPKAA